MEKYLILTAPDADGKVKIRRLSDGLVTTCKAKWLKPADGETYQARSKTKAIRLDGLDWVTEGTV